MAFEGKLVSIGTTDTDVYELGLGLQGVAVLLISNTTAAPISYAVKIYDAALDTTGTLIDGTAVAAETPVKLPGAIPLQAGDKIIMSASATGLRVQPFVSTSAKALPKLGFTPRGEYSAVTTYARNDVVRVDASGISYVSRTDGNVGNTPSSSPTQWMKLVEDGEQGPAGELSSSDIGTTIQPYDIDTAKLDIAQTFTAPQKSDESALVHNTAANFGLKQAWRATVNGSTFIIANPTGGSDKQRYTITVHYTTAHAVQFGNKFKGLGSWISQATAGRREVFEFRYDSSGDFFECMGRNQDINQ